MVAPIDAKASFEVEGETITLHLNWRSLALAAENGIDVLRGDPLSSLKTAVLVRCLAVQEHPDMTDEEAFAIIVKAADKAAGAVASLYAAFGGVASAEGKAKRAKAAA
jgi:hypothetical protein